ncbi:hypothetical protein JOL62DRAFT_554305 [Phyllosticta paracitricarpa]|uniref:Aminoglycoside phosphotransferase domain-containing protein n=1 Tax=Phyllosticta paracitricarpa TaxID=2016321 RepID=A0ABR1NHK3_9PEZI
MGEVPFFSRFGYTEDDRADCREALRRMLPEHELMTHKYQGYCSYTVLLLYRPRRQHTITREEEVHGHHSDGKARLDIEQEEALKQPPPPPNDPFWNQSLIIQFRPVPFALNIDTARLARTIYGAFAPQVRSLGLFGPQTRHHNVHHAHSSRRPLTVTAQSLIPGIPYSAMQPYHSRLSPAQRTRQEALVRDFAAFLARGWRRDDGEHPPGPLAAATPHKLHLLSRRLPSRVLRRAAEETLKRLPLLERLPLALNHGDVVPGNVMVVGASSGGQLGGQRRGEEGGEEELECCRMAGLVDWAEAQVGPWGVPLYGLEFLLGFVWKRLSSSSVSAAGGREGKGEAVSGVGERDGGGGAAWGADAHTLNSGNGEPTTTTWRWTYYDCAAHLRRLFWTELKGRIGELAADGDGEGKGEGGREEEGEGEGEKLMQAVRVARDVGVLLWFGFAWDEGRIDRVVNSLDDSREVCLLETFLGGGALAGEGDGDGGGGSRVGGVKL